MKEMCTIVPHFRCAKCGQDMLFFSTRSGMLIDYKKLISNGRVLSDIKDYLENRNVRYFKCIACNKLYIIDWSNGYPVPLLDKECLAKFGM